MLNRGRSRKLRQGQCCCLRQCSWSTSHRRRPENESANGDAGMRAPRRSLSSVPARGLHRDFEVSDLRGALPAQKACGRPSLWHRTRQKEVRVRMISPPSECAGGVAANWVISSHKGRNSRTSRSNSLSRSRSSDVSPARSPASTSAPRTHLHSVLRTHAHRLAFACGDRQRKTPPPSDRAGSTA